MAGHVRDGRRLEKPGNIELEPGDLVGMDENLGGEEPLLLVDGFNVKVNPVESGVSVRANENADPMHWPASQIVPMKSE